MSTAEFAMRGVSRIERLVGPARRARSKKWRLVEYLMQPVYDFTRSTAALVSLSVHCKDRYWRRTEVWKDLKQLAACNVRLSNEAERLHQAEAASCAGYRGIVVVDR
nr:hypothetical protein [Paraburkholderia tropica]